MAKTLTTAWRVTLLLWFGCAGILRAQGNALLAGPSTLTFTSIGAGLQPSAQQLLVASSGAPLSFSATTTTVSGGVWLAVGAAGGTTPATLTVAVNAAALPPGTYRGTVIISAPGATNPTTLVGVNLTVRTSSQVAVDPIRLSFQYQTGGAVPAPQKLLATSNGAPLSVLPSVDTVGTGDWLQISPAFVNTGGSFDVSVNPVDLAPGVYTGVITLDSAGATNTPITVAVGLTVSASPFLVVSGTSGSGSLAFAHQVGSPAPAPQALVATTSGGPLNFTVTTTTSAGEWLRASSAGGATPGSVAVSIDPTDLEPGTHTGFVNFIAPGAANSPLRVPVTLTVTAGAYLRPAPVAVKFDYQVGAALPAAQTISVNGGGSVINYSVAVTTKSGGAWLAAGPLSGNTDSNLTLAVNPANLALGLYEGTITITSPGAGNSPVTIPVTLNVTLNPVLQTSPAVVSFAVQTGGSAPPTQTIAVSSSGEPINFTASASTATGGNWLFAGTPAGRNGPITLGVTPAGLAAGTYLGTVTITAPEAGNSPVTIPVTLVVSDTALLVASPAALRFTSSSEPQQISLTTTDGTPLSYSVATTSGGNWLQVSPRGGTAPGGLTVSVNTAGLAAGNYNGSLVVSAPSAANSPQVIAVSLTVAPSITASPRELSFRYQVGELSLQAPQTITLGGAGLSFTAAATTASGGDWLRVTPVNGLTPERLSVSVNPVGLAVGNYLGSIAITAPGAANSPVVVNVRLEITGGGIVPAISAVVNGASFQTAAVSPGLIASIFGSGIGPATGVGLRLNAGVVDTTVGDTRVLFDGIPGPILYASSRQVSVVVPYGVAGRARTRVEIEYQGRRSAVAEVQVAESAPAIFTVNSSGTGAGAILNEDATLNGPNNAAARNSVVVIYATGEGQTAPPGVDGQVTGTVLKRPALQVRVTIGGQQAEVLYAGSAPGLVSGVLQVNARVPGGVVPGNTVPVVVAVGGASSQSGVTLAVR
jgi:uncharacterized protein (TIGR03437 family)